MATATIHPLSIKNLEKAIAAKAHKRNQELHKEFYSYDAEDYEFVDINNFTNYKLLLFRCPKSKSTVSIKINQEAL